MSSKDLRKIFEALGFSFDSDGQTDLKCFRCGKNLKIKRSRLRCPNRHKYSYIGYTQDYNYLYYDIHQDLKNGIIQNIKFSEDCEYMQFFDDVKGGFMKLPENSSYLDLFLSVALLLFIGYGLHFLFSFHGISSDLTDIVKKESLNQNNNR
ncbi:MAG: hypothetical protein QM490_03975 [Candidatus Gracilibacteria bacterium]